MSIALLTASSGVVESDISWAVSSGTKVLGAIRVSSDKASQEIYYGLMRKSCDLALVCHSTKSSSEDNWYGRRVPY
jgi:hypothetical protein